MKLDPRVYLFSVVFTFITTIACLGAVMAVLLTTTRDVPQFLVALLTTSAGAFFGLVTFPKANP